METEILSGVLPRAERDAAIPGSPDETIRNAAASVRERLYQLAQKCGEDFPLMRTSCGLALRLRYRPACLPRRCARRPVCVRTRTGAAQARLGQSPYRDRFALKGAMLFSLWGGELYRAT